MKITHRTITASDNHEIDWDKLWEISDRYTKDQPLSGGWDTELEHEQRAISEELGVSMDEAKHLMIEHLEIPQDIFDHPLAASTKVKSATNTCNVGVGVATTDIDDVDTEDEVTSASNVDPNMIDMTYSEVQASESIEISDEYIQDLGNATQEKIVELRPDAEVEIDYRTESGYIRFTVSTKDEEDNPVVITYDVPNEDLTSDLMDDVKYIVGEMGEQLT